MNKKLYHYINYINWKEQGVRETVSITKMEELTKYYKSFGTLAQSKTRFEDWDKDCVYRIEVKGYYKYLFVKDKDLKQWFHIFSCHMFDDSKNTGKPKEYIGAKSNKVEQELFKRFNGVSERVAFGYCDRELLHKCVPKQLYYINYSCIHKNMKQVSKADYSSHYPDNERGLMPDWHYQKKIEGTVKPNKEYPFAFYVNSGHSAEYQRYDTHNWTSHRLNIRLFGNNFKPIEPEKDITILCKASKYTFDSTIEWLYKQRNEGIELIPGINAKTVLNSSIGFKHLKDVECSKNRLDHIAIVTICRANQQMIELFDKVGFDNVLQIVVDGIIYKGKIKIGVDDKYLGCLHQEVTGFSFRMRGINQYLFIDKKGNTNYCHSGLDKNIKVEKLEDIEEWQKEKPMR